MFGTKLRFCSEQNSDSVRNKIAFFVPNTLFGIIYSEQLSGYVGVYFWTSKSRIWVADIQFGSSFLASVKRMRALIVGFMPH